MLVSLKIENFALIDQLELSLQAGLNVLTGETGAGKSIILDAIDAVLGGKATGRWVRTGTDRALVEAAFEVNARIIDWLNHQNIPTHGDRLICRRELTISKSAAGKSSVRSRARLNGTVAKKPQMHALRQLLIEITAQGQTLQLGSADLQRDWLDGFGEWALVQQRDRVAAAYRLATQAQAALDSRRQADQQRVDQLDLFEFQNQELSAAELTDPNELEELQIEHHRLGHSVELQQQSYQVYQQLYENDNGEACADMLGQAEGTLREMLTYDPDIAPILEMVGEALAQVQEAGRQINIYGESIETDPVRLSEIDQRMSQLRQLCRKYNRDLPELIEYAQGIQDFLAVFQSEGQSIEALEIDYQQKQAALLEACAQLTQLRQVAAAQLEQNLIAQLKPLAMERVKFKVDIQAQIPAVHGSDRITFLFSPNPGEPLQPLIEIASGGEMSRFLLALKACFSQVDRVGTLVFDEIDVGVSGRVAQAIAEKLHHLSRHHQVLCVTHQPLVAAMADAHFHVGKHVVTRSAAKAQAKVAAQTDKLLGPSPDLTTSPSQAKVQSQSQSQPTSSKATSKATSKEDLAGERTVVKVTPLDAQSRRDELAQLAGGRSHSEAIAFADSLLIQAETIRQAG